MVVTIFVQKWRLHRHSSLLHEVSFHFLGQSVDNHFNSQVTISHTRYSN